MHGHGAGLREEARGREVRGEIWVGDGVGGVGGDRGAAAGRGGQGERVFFFHFFFISSSGGKKKKKNSPFFFSLFCLSLSQSPPPKLHHHQAAYGIARNWAAFAALVTALRERGELTGAEVRSLMVEHGAVPFADPFCDGFGWDEEGELVWPGKKAGQGQGQGEGGSGRNAALPDAYVARLRPRKRGPVEAPPPSSSPEAGGESSVPRVNPFYPPGKVEGMPEFGERPAVFRFEDSPSQ